MQLKSQGEIRSIQFQLWPAAFQAFTWVFSAAGKCGSALQALVCHRNFIAMATDRSLSFPFALRPQQPWIRKTADASSFATSSQDLRLDTSIHSPKART